MSNYKFKIDQVVFNRLTQEKCIVTMLQSTTNKDINGKYCTINEYQCYGPAGYEWYGEGILSDTIKFE